MRTMKLFTTFKLVEMDGFEPPRLLETDLQSVAFDPSATSPLKLLLLNLAHPTRIELVFSD